MAPVPFGKNNNRAKILALVLFSLSFMFLFSLSPAHAVSPLFWHRMESASGAETGQAMTWTGTSGFEPAQFGNGAYSVTSGTAYTPYTGIWPNTASIQRGSLEFWFKCKSDGFVIPSTYFTRYLTLGAVVIRSDVGGVKVYSNSGSNLLQRTYTPVTGQLHHVAWSWDASGIGGTGKTEILYWDGVETASDTLPITATAQYRGDQWDNFYLGSTGSGSDYIAQFDLDNVKIWNYAKTDFSDRFNEELPMPTTWYVDSASSPGGSGTIGSPFKTINSAEAAALSGDQIRVKQGTYSLTAPGTGTLTLKSGVYLKGGYDAGWNQVVGPSTTIISGEGSVRCMYGEALSAATTIENFTIKNGYADHGGGLYLTGSSPTITNCTFTSNRSSGTGGGMDHDITSYGGGGICNDSSSPTISNCAFTSNIASYSAGGIDNENSSFPTIKNCTFTSNSATYYGGGICNWNSSPEVQNCTFTSNSAGDHGGGICNESYSSPIITNCTFTSNSVSVSNGYGGGIFSESYSNPTITNCAFTLNSAYQGGGVMNGSSNPTITNCTFTLNSASNGGSGIYNNASSPIIKNSIIYGNSGGNIFKDDWSFPTVTYSCIQGGYTGTGNIATDPLFVNAPGDVHLQAGSPCKDTGTSVGAPSVDLDGISRPQGSGYDMGAYEFLAQSSYTTKVGTSGSWQWRKAQPGELVPSGTPAAWQWRTWEAGSLRKVPQGAAPAWNWGNE